MCVPLAMPKNDQWCNSAYAHILYIHTRRLSYSHMLTNRQGLREQSFGFSQTVKQLRPCRPWLSAPQLWSSLLTKGATRPGATRQAQPLGQGSSDLNLQTGPFKDVSVVAAFHLFPPLANFRRLGDWHLGFKIILMAHGQQVTQSLSTCSVHKLHTHTHICTQTHLVSVDLPSGFSLTASTEHSLLAWHHQEYHVLWNSMDLLHKTGNLWECPLIWINNPQPTSYQSTSN